MRKLSEQTLNGINYEVIRMKRRHQTLVTKLIELGMGFQQADKVATEYLVNRTPLPEGYEEAKC